jgi:hypothetical protein
VLLLLLLLDAAAAVPAHFRGAAMGEHLIKPGEYQKRLGLGWASRINNTFIDYTISWQSSRVTFAMNGIALVTRKAGQEVKWMDDANKQRR